MNSPVHQHNAAGALTTPEHAIDLRDATMKSRFPRRAKKDRLIRTVVLGAITVLLAIVWLARELGMDRDELLGYLGTSLLFIGLTIGLAVVAVGLIWLIKKMLG